MKKHTHKWKKTGSERYSLPGQYEEKCSCGKKRWKEYKEGIPTITLKPGDPRPGSPEWESFRKKFLHGN